MLSHNLIFSFWRPGSIQCGSQSVVISRAPEMDTLHEWERSLCFKLWRHVVRVPIHPRVCVCVCVCVCVILTGHTSTLPIPVRLLFPTPPLHWREHDEENGTILRSWCSWSSYLSAKCSSTWQMPNGWPSHRGAFQELLTVKWLGFLTLQVLRRAMLGPADDFWFCLNSYLWDS